MIRHIVLVRARAGVSDADLDAIFAAIGALCGVLPGMRSVAYGRSRSPERIERGYLHGMIADFDDWDALARYAEEPRHQAQGARLVAASEGGIDGILVFDLETPG